MQQPQLLLQKNLPQPNHKTSKDLSTPPPPPPLPPKIKKVQENVIKFNEVSGLLKPDEKDFKNGQFDQAGIEQEISK